MAAAGADPKFRQLEAQHRPVILGVLPQAFQSEFLQLAFLLKQVIDAHSRMFFLLHRTHRANRWDWGSVVWLRPRPTFPQ